MSDEIEKMLEEHRRGLGSEDADPDTWWLAHSWGKKTRNPWQVDTLRRAGKRLRDHAATGCDRRWLG